MMRVCEVYSSDLRGVPSFLMGQLTSELRMKRVDALKFPLESIFRAAALLPFFPLPFTLSVISAADPRL
jgi:hypothetical protein